MGATVILNFKPLVLDSFSPLTLVVVAVIVTTDDDDVFVVVVVVVVGGGGCRGGDKYWFTLTYGIENAWL